MPYATIAEFLAWLSFTPGAGTTGQVGFVGAIRAGGPAGPAWNSGPLSAWLNGKLTPAKITTFVQSITASMANRPVPDRGIDLEVMNEYTALNSGVMASFQGYSVVYY
jgi:hypothetical protein